MGYYVDITDSTYTIPSKHVATAYNSIKGLMLWGQSPTSLLDAFHIVGFSATQDDNGDIRVTGYSAKTSDERDFLDSFHAYATGYVCWQGEDGRQWRDRYDGPTPVSEAGYTVFGISMEEAAELNASDDPGDIIFRGTQPR